MILLLRLLSVILCLCVCRYWVLHSCFVSLVFECNTVCFMSVVIECYTVVFFCGFWVLHSLLYVCSYWVLHSLLYVFSYWVLHSAFVSVVIECNTVYFLSVVKVLEKRHIMRERKTQYVMREKEVLMKLNHPFFIRLFYTFQDTDRLCIL